MCRVFSVVRYKNFLYLFLIFVFPSFSSLCKMLPNSCLYLREGSLFNAALAETSWTIYLYWYSLIKNALYFLTRLHFIFNVGETTLLFFNYLENETSTCTRIWMCALTKDLPFTEYPVFIANMTLMTVVYKRYRCSCFLAINRNAWEQVKCAGTSAIRKKNSHTQIIWVDNPLMLTLQSIVCY